MSAVTQTSWSADEVIEAAKAQDTTAVGDEQWGYSWRLWAVGGLALAGVVGGTSSTPPVPLSYVRYCSSWTSSRAEAAALATQMSEVAQGLVTSPVEQADDTVRRVYEESGLTWEQLGRLFGVSRRAVHLWANGGRMNAAHREMLHQIDGVLRSLPAETREGRRSALLSVRDDGTSVFDTLLRHRAEVPAVEGTFAPEQLLGTLHDRTVTQSS